MEKKTLIFTATYNESENIEKFLKIVDELNLNADILIIDDNSPDHTSKIIQEHSKSKKNIHLITRNSKEGLDTAHKMAYEYSRRNNYEFLITLDADLTHDPKKIPDFINELNTNSFVIGSRYMEGGKTDMKGLRLFLSFFGNKFIKFILNVNCSEFTSSFRGFNLTTLGDFDLKIVSSKGYSFFMETLYQVNKKGIIIREIPIYAKQRDKGKSKIAKIEIIRTFKNLFKLKFIN
tara:strand:+ start:265 stop:966 length:702 start_codon:yes stop_codon:yes gene_type:complete